MILINLLRASTFRLTLLYMFFSGGSVLLLFGFIYWKTAGFMERQAEETIGTEILALSERYQLMGLAGLVHMINQRAATDFSMQSLYLVTDTANNVLAGNLRRWPKVKDARDGWLYFALDASARNPHELNAMARHILLQGGFNLLVGRDVSGMVRIKRRIVDALIWGIGITGVLGLGGGLLMSRGMLRRIDVINRASREIMRGDLARRIPVKGTGDEFDRLIGNLNNMLDQIVRLMTGVRQVSDNIAHDLRGPLNRLRTRLEVSLLGERTAETYRQAIAESLREIDDLLVTFNALLKIAQAEAGLTREDSQVLDLGTIAQDMAELYEPLAEEKGLTFADFVQPEIKVLGIRHLLSQAIANLLDNAIKYTPRGGSLTLTLRGTARHAELTVTDTGPGIPPEDRDKVLERFYRLESSRNKPGSGLGLSLVSAVAKLHEARLELRDNSPGLAVTMRFPRVAT